MNFHLLNVKTHTLQESGWTKGAFSHSVFGEIVSVHVSVKRSSLWEATLTVLFKVQFSVPLHRLGVGVRGPALIIISSTFKFILCSGPLTPVTLFNTTTQEEGHYK